MGQFIKMNSINNELMVSGTINSHLYSENDNVNPTGLRGEDVYVTIMTSLRD
jgi:hypothetical protein